MSNLLVGCVLTLSQHDLGLEVDETDHEIKAAISYRTCRVKHDDVLSAAQGLTALLFAIEEDLDKTVSSLRESDKYRQCK